MNGYPNRRSPGSASSARQSAQVALSAATRARRRPDGSLGAIENPPAPFGAMACAVTRSTRASGGASRSTKARNFRTESAEPSTSANTPADIIPTPPGQPEPRRQRVYERAEPDSLDHALHADRRPDALDHPPSLSRAWSAGELSWETPRGLPAAVS